eukprot:Em0004g1010a
MASLDDGKFRDCIETIRARLAQAQQLKASGQQISQAEEIQKRLKDVVARLENEVKDFSLGGVQRKLEALANNLRLKFDFQRPQQQVIFFLSCDLVQGHAPPEESDVLLKLLRAHNFSEFELHIRSLNDLYVQAAGMDKSKVFQALMATEKVLLSIAESSPQPPLEDMIMSNPLGHVSDRTAGLPMKLTFFVTPCDALHHPAFKLAERIGCLPHGLGISGKVVFEKSLQLFNLSLDPNLFNRSNANFFPLTNQSSVRLPMSFMFQLSEGIPVCGAVVEQLHQSLFGTTNVVAEQSICQMTTAHINELITRKKKQTVQEQKDIGFESCYCVSLPEQRHYYYMPVNATVPGSVDFHPKPSELGGFVSKVPFTHPGNIFNIITLLRKQLVYNTLVSSCIGISVKDVAFDALTVEHVFNVSTSPPEVISVSIGDMKAKDANFTVEFYISDTQTRPTVRVKFGSQVQNLPHLSQILARCFSIPITLRAAFKKPSLLCGAAGAFQLYQQEIFQFMERFKMGAPEKIEQEKSILLNGSQKAVVSGVKRKWAD